MVLFDKWFLHGSFQSKPNLHSHYKPIQRKMWQKTSKVTSMLKIWAHVGCNWSSKGQIKTPVCLGMVGILVEGRDSWQYFERQLANNHVRVIWLKLTQRFKRKFWYDLLVILICLFSLSISICVLPLFSLYSLSIDSGLLAGSLDTILERSS